LIGGPANRALQAMSIVIKPSHHKDVETAVQWAVSEAKSFEVLGHGSKSALGRPARTDARLDMSVYAGIILYEPEELVLSARAGTPLTEIAELLAQNGQELAFEPMDYGPLLGLKAGRGTIGGAVAANLSGPRRIRAGAARDHFLGVLAVSGRGESFRSGGRVVKNVTGYDLCKLLAGSWGTLAVLSEVTLKVLPRAPTEATLAIFGLDDATASRAMATAVGSPFGVSGAAHLPDYLASRFDGLTAAEATTVLRVEGVATAVSHCIDALKSAVTASGESKVLDQDQSQVLWRAIRDARPFWVGGDLGDRALWRVSTAPSRGCEIAAKISPSAQLYYDWAGGLIWIAPWAASDGGAADIRTAVAQAGGHANLVRAPAALRASVDPFQPEPSPLAALTKRVKQSFDPKGVLNPGRIWAGV
jgi:glycolate oxidase FAD binding subunit